MLVTILALRHLLVVCKQQLQIHSSSRLKCSRPGKVPDTCLFEKEDFTLILYYRTVIQGSHCTVWNRHQGMCFSDTERSIRWRHSPFTFQIKVKSIKLPKPIFIWRKFSCAAVILISHEYRMMECKQSCVYGKAEKNDKAAYTFTPCFLPSATTLQCRASTWEQQ